MFGSYGSYSSMCSTRPMDITPSNVSSRDASCAFPSWPRRDSLESDREERPTSYLSDDDLFLSDPFDDDTQSVSSAGSSSPAMHSPPNVISDAELIQAEREHQAALQREFIRVVVNEKERRRAAAARKQRRNSPSKKSTKTKLSSIEESNE